MNDDDILLISTLLSIVVIFLIRRIVLWYWRIGEIVDIFGKIESHLARLAGVPTEPEKPKKKPMNEKVVAAIVIGAAILAIIIISLVAGAVRKAL